MKPKTIKRLLHAAGQAALESLEQGINLQKAQLDELKAIIASSEITPQELLAHEAKISEALEEQEQLLKHLETVQKALRGTRTGKTGSPGEMANLSPVESATGGPARDNEDRTEHVGPRIEDQSSIPAGSSGNDTKAAEPPLETPGGSQGGLPPFDEANDSLQDSRGVSDSAPSPLSNVPPSPAPKPEPDVPSFPSADVPGSPAMPRQEVDSKLASDDQPQAPAPPARTLDWPRPPAPFGLGPALRFRQQDAQFQELKKQIQELWSAIHQLNKENRQIGRSSLPRSVIY